MLSIPIGGWTDCARAAGKNASSTAGTTYAACMHGCAAAGSASCQSWQFDDATKVCTHNADVPPTAHATGMHCGVAPGAASSAGWTTGGEGGGGGLTWSQRPTSTGPSIGDITLQAVVDNTAAAASAASYAVHDDPAALFQDFASATPSGAGRGSAGSVARVAAHGAAWVSTSVAANSNATLTIVFAWHFADRNYHAGGG